MEDEKLKIFDENRNPIGVATREEVHRIGHWHETFHCWFISKDDEIDYIYLQLRSNLKKDFPNLYDITAAGHLLADETVYDGVRELQEEIGIEVSFDELLPLGIIDYRVVNEDLIDNEFAYVYLYDTNITFDEFILQKEEVSGVIKVEFNDFYELWVGGKEEVRVQGFEINSDGSKTMINEIVGREKFVPHEISYYISVLKLIREKINK